MRISPPVRLAIGLGMALIALVLIFGPSAFADSPNSPAAQATTAPTAAATTAPTAAATTAATAAATTAPTAAATAAATAAPTTAPTPAALPTTGATPGGNSLLLAALGVVLLVTGLGIALARPARRSL